MGRRPTGGRRRRGRHVGLEDGQGAPGSEQPDDLRQVRQAGGREQVHRLGEEQGAQLAQLPLLRRHGHLPGSCPEERRRRRVPEGLQLQAAPRVRTLQGRRIGHREGQERVGATPDGLLGREVSPQRRAVQLRRDPGGRRPRPEARLRDVQEGRPRRLLLQRAAACGSRR